MGNPQVTTGTVQLPQVGVQRTKQPPVKISKNIGLLLLRLTGFPTTLVGSKKGQRQPNSTISGDPGPGVPRRRASLQYTAVSVTLLGLLVAIAVVLVLTPDRHPPSLEAWATDLLKVSPPPSP